ncbi:hypothetical protein BLTE_27450 [Blastochloris tepida]|uniref:Glycoside-hydrolase family GH114 TIM-barrel domain-containing protein n=2 Tax=Blastochloris tepida TaxID=2233851 RepID=A0A348G3C7_9HYPH|nr:hypothetical protein BLTE_27450 [Blastochloris tepida]
MTAGSGLVLGYFSLGEVEDYRSYYSSIPETAVGPADPQWPGCYEVAYWTADWLEVAKTEVTKLIEAGYDGAYFDVVDEYQTDWAQANAPGGDAAGAMKTLVEALSAYAKSLDADFQIWVNGAEELLTDETYLDAIDGMLKENLFYDFDGSSQISAEDTEYMLEYLHLATAAGKPVIDIEYVAGNAGKIADVYAKAAAAGVGIYVAELDLAGIDYADNRFSSSNDDVLDGRNGAFTLAGGLGDDTYITDGGDTLIEEADAGTDTVKASVSYVLGANLENLTLIGNAAIDGTGNDLDNVIAGNAAATRIDGGAGADAMAGGAGNDTYIVDNAGDTVTELAKQGTDLVLASVSFALGGNVENLVLTGTGNINGTGNALANRITGNDGNNRLDGGAGADTMAGGLGDDLYVVDNAKDVVTELAGQGTDTVEASVSHMLGANLENLVLTGSAAIKGTGNALDNTITGNDGANVLDGGAGADALAGGAGNDTYIVDNLGDTVREAAGAGTDTVKASVSFTLGANVENLTLTGKAAIDGNGNGLDNVITGNAAANVIEGGAGNDTLAGGAGIDTVSYADAAGAVTVSLAITTAQDTGGAGTDRLGGFENILGSAFADTLTGDKKANRIDGGAGADTMAGGAGNDTYVVDNAGDTVTELAKQGTDTVLASVSFMLGANVENLTLTGSGNINGTGNALANKITGNDGNNRLDGGAGADTMAGGLGDDLYVVDNAKDVVTELVGQGTDTVEASVSHMLGANLENLVLTGTANINGTGNALDNTIAGNAGANLLNGGAGNDTLIGGGGADILTGSAGMDTFVFAAGFGADRITDFTVGDDVIRFDSDLFADFDAVLAAASQVGADTVITLDADNTLTLANVETSSLLLASFDFA